MLPFFTDFAWARDDVTGYVTLSRARAISRASGQLSVHNTTTSHIMARSIRGRRTLNKVGRILYGLQNVGSQGDRVQLNSHAQLHGGRRALYPFVWIDV